MGGSPGGVEAPAAGAPRGVLRGLVAVSGRAGHSVPAGAGGAALQGAAGSGGGLGRGGAEGGRGPACFTLSLAVFLYGDPPRRGGGPRGLVHKGGRDGDLTPTMSLLPGSNRVSFRVSTGDSEASRETWGTSVGELPSGKWVPVAFASCPLEGDENRALMRLHIAGVLDSSLELTAPAVTNPGAWFFGGHGRVHAPEALIANVEVYPTMLADDGIRMAGERALADLPEIRAGPRPEPTLWYCDEASAPVGGCAAAFLGDGSFHGTAESAEDTSPVERWTLRGGGAAQPSRGGQCSVGAPKAYGQQMHRRGLDALQAGAHEVSWLKRERLFNEAVESFSVAAAYGHAEAHWSTATLALSGLSSRWADESAAEAFALAELLRGAVGGHTPCHISLGRRSLAGAGVPRSLEAGLYFYEQAGERAYEIYREPGKQVLPEHVELTESVHIKREDHRGERDQVTEYLRARSEKGDAAATLSLGQRYYSGTHGLEQDLGRALEYFRAADRQGNRRGTLGAAKMLLKGEGAPKDVNASREYFDKTIESGGAALAAEAFNGLGFMFYTGTGGEKNYTKALQMFKQAADVGSVDGHVNTAIMAASGLGTPGGAKNATLAYSMYVKVTGSPGPAYHAAKAESGGVGTARNASLAVRHFRVITGTGPWTRCLARGLKTYLAGDLLESLLWYTQASELGLRVGAENQAWVIEELRRRARSWDWAVFEALVSPGLLRRRKGAAAIIHGRSHTLAMAEGRELNLTRLELTRLQLLRTRLLLDEGIADAKRGWAAQQLGHAAGREEEREAMYAKGVSLGDIQSHFNLAEILWAHNGNRSQAAELYAAAHAAPHANTAATTVAWVFFLVRSSLHASGLSLPARSDRESLSTLPIVLLCLIIMACAALLRLRGRQAPRR